MKNLIVVISIIAACCLVVQVGEAAGNENGDTDQAQTDRPSMQSLMQNQEQVLQDSKTMLDSMVGHFKGNPVINGVQHTAELVIEPRILDNYYKGRYTLKASSGDIIYDAFVVFSFNAGAMSYLFFYFGSEGFVRNYMGLYAEHEIVVHSRYPQGMGFTRWTVEDENTIKKEDWKPQATMKQRPEGDPDTTILLNRVQ